MKIRSVGRGLVATLSMATIVAGCGWLEPPSTTLDSDGSIVLVGSVPAAVRDRAPLPSCGVENATRQDGPWNVSARRCLVAAYAAGAGAEFVSTRPTVEGDSFRVVYRVLGAAEVEILIDSTQDAWSNRTWERIRCRQLTIDETATPAPDFAWGEGCSTETIE